MGCFCFLVIFTSCPGDDTDCNDFGSIGRVDDLILLTPEQTEYNQGHEITLQSIIPSVNNYFGQEYNIYEITNDHSDLLVLAFNELFLDNTLTFIIGSQGEFPNWFNLPYNLENQSYELERVIQLDKLGLNYLPTLDDITFQETDYCNRFRLDTNVMWTGDALVEFTVTE